MDGQYPPNGVNTTSSGQTYPSPTAIAPNQLQTGSPLPQTLPPLQPPASAMQPLYGSHPHTPRTPGTPNTPGSNNLPSYQQTSQPGGRGGIYSMPQSQYPPPQAYGTSGAMMPQATTTASHPQPIAPAPVGGRGPPVLRPMPPGGIMSQPGVSSPYGPGMMQQSSVLQHEGEQPTHVVGSQGRRGILPSAPGRPAAPAAGTGGTKNTVIPVKDADGKFPCPHCTKTYLHAKHLKRHLLRHTGDRPYMCVLCRDTFSRSDILKRHFQKCSIRRGNPTGASHLSHPQAHVKKNAQAQKAAGLGHEGDLNHLNGLTNIQGDNMVHPFGMVPVQDGMNNMAGDQNHLSRSSSIGRLDNGNNADRRQMPVMGASQPYGADVSSSMQQQQLPGYSMPPGQNGMPMYGNSNQNQQSGLDWSQMFQAGAHQTYVNTSFIPNLGQTQIATKTEPNAEPGAAGPRPSDPQISNWGMSSHLQNPYNQLSDQILNFFYPPNQAIDPQSAGMNLYFSPDNIKDFLDKYTHFHIHVPIIHVATFKIMDAYTGLLAGMCCIGACYSDRVTPSNVREMMDFLCVALERDSQVFRPELQTMQQSIASRSDVEELQAVMFLCILLIWNGTPQQRNRARQIHPLLASGARKFNLFHSSNDLSMTELVRDFGWASWIDNERRNRSMFGIFLCDTAMGLYFNAHPLFDVFEMHLPLPADDAAWDANSAEDCASALGLKGSDAAQVKNPNGTQRAKQPEMDWAIKALLHSSTQIQPGSTNLYGKFILIHGILALIKRTQLEGAAQFSNYGTPPPSDWMTSAGAHHGRGSPMNGTSPKTDPQSLQALNFALDKFKSNWDVDMSSQFPPTIPAPNNPRRHGFSRDGIHFYWLAKYLLQHTRPAELQMPSDARFMQVIQLLKSVRAWVMSDGASRGEELGSIGEIDDHFGAMDLTLEMTKMFTPLPQVVVDDAGTGSVKMAGIA
ncbi:fungal-specific transcription factor domain-containing protein [Dactylonectria estremocensis]|uniref:Fungal-specific transcription factor domain-containing protein n=1 Tax=Dactylonectria estremocensis TaxID=1079267 RepID=A0A9P9EY71_9HYPO|nr:fungal-specific transcription factor domain-containing protein [Dactylonectria estremocensis]